MTPEEHMDPGEAATRVEAFFSDLERDVFAGDPATNPNLHVEVIEAQPIAGGVVLVVIAPWTISGILFLEDETFSDTIIIDGRRLPVLVNEVPSLGRYWSVVVVREVGSLTSQDEAREIVAAVMVPFLEAVAEATANAGIEDQSRRDLFRTLARGNESRQEWGAT